MRHTEAYQLYEHTRQLCSYVVCMIQIMWCRYVNAYMNDATAHPWSLAPSFHIPVDLPTIRSAALPPPPQPQTLRCPVQTFTDVSNLFLSQWSRFTQRDNSHSHRHLPIMAIINLPIIRPYSERLFLPIFHHPMPCRPGVIVQRIPSWETQSKFVE